MSNDRSKQEQSPENHASGSGSEEMKGDETQQAGSTGKHTRSEDDSNLRKPMPKPEDYDFFLNVRRSEQTERTENDEPTEH